MIRCSYYIKVDVRNAADSLFPNLSFLNEINKIEKSDNTSIPSS